MKDSTAFFVDEPKADQVAPQPKTDIPFTVKAAALCFAIAWLGLVVNWVLIKVLLNFWLLLLFTPIYIVWGYQWPRALLACEKWSWWLTVGVYTLGLTGALFTRVVVKASPNAHRVDFISTEMWLFVVASSGLTLIFLAMPSSLRAFGITKKISPEIP